MSSINDEIAASLDQEDFKELIQAAEQIRKVIILPNNKVDYTAVFSLYHQSYSDYMKKTPIPVGCNKGCSFCCYLRVDVMPGEVEWIFEGIELTDKERNDLKKAVDIRVHKWKKKPEGEFRLATPCVFLKEGKCSIYERRPLNCRSMVIADSKSCERAFYEGNDDDTSFHTHPKLTLAIAVLAIISIQNNISVIQVLTDRQFSDNRALLFEEALQKVL